MESSARSILNSLSPRKSKLNSLQKFQQSHSTPTFVDTFDRGYLNRDKWTPSAYSAPGGGLFYPDYVTLDGGCLTLKLHQTVDADLGSEIVSTQKFGYGLYEFVARMGSTSQYHDMHGVSVSGGISGLFSYTNNSETEIDFESQGQHDNWVEMTAWQNLNRIGTYGATVQSASAAFHTYQYLWLPGTVEFYIDGILRATFMNAPTAPAHIILNHWGTNNPNFGGWETLDVSRYLHCRRVAFTAQ